MIAHDIMEKISNNSRTSCTITPASRIIVSRLPRKCPPAPTAIVAISFTGILLHGKLAMYYPCNGKPPVCQH
jgi:hypothetical protein